MDLLIRQHLAAAQVEPDNHSLDKAYKLMKEADTESSSIDVSDSFSSDLYVLCAEQAFQVGNFEVSQDCLQMYFNGTPLPNQFFGRAYLCQAQLFTPHSVDDLEELDKCVECLLKAVEFAKPQERYHFLIYNASVLFWEMVRPFVKSGYRQHLIPALTQILNALEQMDDADQESDWIAELMIELLQCLLEAKNMKDAADLASTASEYIKTSAPHRYEPLFSLMVFNKLMDPNTATKEMNGSIKLSIIYKIQKIRWLSQRHTTSKDITSSLNEVYKLLLTTDGDSTSDVTFEERLTLLLEFARLCLELNCDQLAFTCISDLKNSSVTDPGKLIQMECLECEYEGTKITSYTKSAVESHLKLIRRLEHALDTAFRLSDQNIIQVTSASLWNLCLPLMQNNLRKHLRKPLLSIAEKLEQIDSNLTLLRCQVYLTLSQIEEDEDRIEIGIGHLQKAMLMHEEQYQTQVQTALHRLTLCAMLYKKPDRVEDQATMMIEQAKKVSPKDPVRKKRSILVNVGLALAPNEFQMVLDSENEIKVSTGKDTKGEFSFLCAKAQHYAKCVNKAGEHMTALEDPNSAEERVRLWADLAKVARKQEVWDVCRAACRFCLLYDDGRWTVPKAEIVAKKSSSAVKEADTPKKSSSTVKGDDTPKKSSRAVKGDDTPKKSSSTVKADDLAEESSSTVKGDNTPKKSSSSIKGDDTPKKSSSTVKADDSPKKSSSAVKGDDVVKESSSTVKGDYTPKKSSSTLKGDDTPKKSSSTVKGDDSRASILESVSSTVKPSFSPERNLLRVLAEIRFINAEVTIHLLRSEGCLLNTSPVPPEDTSMRPMGYVSIPADEDPEWITYRDWIMQLSQYVTENFLKAAQFGVELDEAWITHNAVVYFLNHNKHLITTGKQAELVNALQTLLDAIKQTGHHGNTVLLVMLCNAFAQGLMLPGIPSSTKKAEPAKAEKGKKKAAGKPSAKSKNAPLLSVDPNALPDLQTALEICEFILTLTNGRIPQEVIPIAARHQILATWVKVKQLLEEQIGPELGTDDENNNEGQNPMTRVLVALEMYSCNGLGFMDYIVPTLSELATMCSECSWSDRLVELQSLVRIAHFAYNSHDYELAKACCQEALVKDEAKRARTGVKKPEPGNYILEQEMLSTAACIQGQSLMQTLDGKKQLHTLALKAFQTSASHAGEAGCMRLVMIAAKHFWNACLPLLSSQAERRDLKEPTLAILKAFRQAESMSNQQYSAAITSHGSCPEIYEAPDQPSVHRGISGQIKQESRKVRRESKLSAEMEATMGARNDTTSLHLWPTMDVEISETTDSDFSAGDDSDDKDLALRVALYALLFRIHADKNDWGAGMKVLDEAIKILPRSKQKLLIFKHRVLTNARLGCDFLMDIQKFKNESEDNTAYTWHKLALNSKNTMEQLTGFQNSVLALQKPENEWQKVDYLSKLAKWLYFKQFPVADAMSQLGWALDIVLQMKLTKDDEEKTHKGKSKPKGKYSAKDHRKGHMKQEDTAGDPKMIDMDHVMINSMDDLNSVRQLEYLVRINTLMAIMSGHSSPYHMENCLMAYAYVMHIWKISLSAAGAFIKALAKNPTASAPQNPQSASSKKGKGKKETKQVSPSRERPKRKGHIEALPTSVEDWASYDCPDEVREAFKADTSSYSINRINIKKPTYTLYFIDLLVKELESISLTHLTIPVLQLAEVIAHDVVESESLSDLYHLRLAQVCGDLKLKQYATYHEKVVGRQFITEMEQVICRQEIGVKKKKLSEQEGGVEEEADMPFITPEKILDLDVTTGKGLHGLSLPFLWLEKAEVLIQLGLYQPARLLLSEAHTASKEVGEKFAVSRCLCLLAELANNEKNHGQAKALLEEAEQVEAKAELWFRITLSLVRAVLGEETEGKEKTACTILQTTISALKQVLTAQVTRRAELGFLLLTLEVRETLIQIKAAQGLSAGGDKSSQRAVILLEACDKLSQLEKNFLEQGYKENSAQVIMEHSNVQRLLAKYTEDEERKHCHYIEAFNLAQRAVYVQEEVNSDIESLLSPHEMRNISLPITRRLARMKVSLVELALEMLELVCTEKQQKIILEKQKGSIHRLVEEFIRATPDYTSPNQEWIVMGRTLGHIVLSHIESLQTLHSSCSDIRAQCLYLAGRCLRLRSLSIGPLSPDMYWNESILEATKLSPEIRPQTEAETNGSHLTFGDVQMNTQQKFYIKKLKELRMKQSLAQRYLSQATEVLLQSMNIALNKKCIPTLAAASLEMVSCLGIFEPGSAGLLLALHQSCRASVIMEEILLRATHDTSSSQLAALLQLRHHLQQKGDVTSNLFRSIEQKLSATSKAMENLLIQPQHLNMLNEFPPTFNIIVLQHSDDRSFLYGAVLEKTKVNVGQKGKPSPESLKTNVARCAVDCNRLSDLLEKMNSYKQEVLQDHLKAEYLQSANIQKAEFENAVPQKNIMVGGPTDDEVQQRLSLCFLEVVEAMNAYLEPILKQFNFSCFSPQTLAPPAGGTKGRDRPKSKERPESRERPKSKERPESKERPKSKEREEKPQSAQGVTGPPAEMGECVLLLTDRLLMDLPLEALGVLQEEGISSVSRDFSLQLLYNRFHKDDPAENEPKRDTKSAKDPKAKQEPKKNIKAGATNRVLPPNCIQVETHHFKYIVDPYHEAEATEAVSPAHVMKEVLVKHHHLTQRWEGFVGRQHVPSHAEWEELLNSGSAFLFYGPERFLSHLLVEKVIAMNFSGLKQAREVKAGVGQKDGAKGKKQSSPAKAGKNVKKGGKSGIYSGDKNQLMILLDRSETNQSFLRQSNIDAEKSLWRLSLERPVETAVLLSLTGVRSIMANLWNTTLEQNAARLSSIAGSLLGIGKTAGQTMRDMQKVRPPPPMVQMNEDSSQPDEGGGEAVPIEEQPQTPPPQPTSFSYVLYGLPNVVVM